MSDPGPVAARAAGMREFLDRLAADIWNAPEFQTDLEEVCRLAALQALGREVPVMDEKVLRRLVRSAPTLSLSNRPELGEASYRIAASAYSLAGESLPGLTPLLSLVLSRRGNFPAIDLMLPETEQGLPTGLLLESHVRRMTNTVEVNGRPRSLTDFQRLVWDDLERGRSIAVSAPTSAGKSYVFRAYAEAAIQANRRLVSIILVPTRALINQMQDQLRAPFEDAGGRVLSVPRLQQHDGPLCYVLTQERLEVLLDAAPDFAGDLLLVDEAQSVGDDGRGVILQSVVDELLARRPAAQVLFTLPTAANADVLGRLFEAGSFVERRTDESPVGQNLILLSVDGARPDIVHARLWRRGRPVAVETIDVGRQMTTAPHRLAHLAYEFGRNAPSIVYADGQDQCERIAGFLTQLSMPDDAEEGPVPAALEELSRLVKDHVHPAYSLAETVRAGVGFHYGYIPSLVRKEIEHAFDDGHLRFIVCTTTLLKGVNLPARNIFMARPRVAKQPMGATDFWNLAGRAGRLGREFDGNVFLVDYDDWKTKPLADERRTTVASAMERVLLQSDAFTQFVREGSAPAGTKATMENTFARLFRDQQNGRLDQTLQRLALPVEAREQAAATLRQAASEIDLPSALLQASPWVSPRRQANLLAWARKKLKAAVPIEDLVPPHPFDPAAYQRLADLIRRCHRELEGRKDKSFLYYANLGLSWMKGKTIPEIIQDIEDYKLKTGQEYKIHRLIREVLGNIEKDLRFRYVRLTACYISVLKFALTEAGHSDWVPRVPAIPLYLEMGASSETMLSFMELGLSRITARLLQQESAFSDLDAGAAQRWLSRNSTAVQRLPRACQREIDALR